MIPAVVRCERCRGLCVVRGRWRWEWRELRLTRELVTCKACGGRGYVLRFAAEPWEVV